MNPTTSTLPLSGNKAIFLDKSALLVFMDQYHPHHAKAVSYFLEWDDLERPLVTLNFIVYELHQWLLEHSGYDHAQFFLNVVQKAEQNRVLTVLSVDEELEQEALHMITDQPQYELSFIRACILLVMGQLEIRRIFSFDPFYKGVMKYFPHIQLIPSEAG